MHRLSLLLLTAAITIPTPGHAQLEVDRLDLMRRELVGKTIRVSPRKVGVVESIRPDAMVLNVTGKRQEIPLSKLESIEIQHDRSRPTSDLGLVAGGMAGGLTGAVFASSMDSNSKRLPIIAAGVLLGMMAGGSGSDPESIETVELGRYLAPRWDARIRGRTVRLRRLTDDGEYLKGTVVVSTPDELVLADRQGRRIAVSRHELASVEAFRYRPDVALLAGAAGGFLGMVGGGAMGLVGGKLLIRDDSYGYGAAVSAVALGTLGGVVGLIMGLTRGGETWTEIPRGNISAPQFSIAPGGPGGLGFTVQGSF